MSRSTDQHAANDERFAEVVASLNSRWPENKIDPSLDRVRALVDTLGDPQQSYPVIAVAGTNGKTSTARMIEALLRAFGLRTGLFTSPHLTDITERIRLDGQPIDHAGFVAAYDDVATYADLIDARSAAHGEPQLSYFEFLTAMAFAAFADAPVDIAVIEVGVGGRWDCTNVADAAVAVITPIGLDHMDLLGDTVAQIAGEKAGIIKPGAAVVVGPQDDDALAVIRNRCREVGASPVYVGRDIAVENRFIAVGGQMVDLRGIGGLYQELFVPLFGVHQAGNALMALAAVESFLGSPLDASTVADGFALATSPGRLEVVRRSPTVILDAAHNPDGARALADGLSDSFDFTRLVGVVGMLADKDVEGVLQALEPILTTIVATQNSSPRCLPADDLGALAADIFGADRVEVEPHLARAIERAVDLAEEEGELGGSGVIVTGSVVTVGESRSILVGEGPS